MRLTKGRVKVGEMGRLAIKVHTFLLQEERRLAIPIMEFKGHAQSNEVVKEGHYHIGPASQRLGTPLLHPEEWKLERGPSKGHSS